MWSHLNKQIWGLIDPRSPQISGTVLGGESSIWTNGHTGFFTPLTSGLLAQYGTSSFSPALMYTNRVQ